MTTKTKEDPKMFRGLLGYGAGSHIFSQPVPAFDHTIYLDDLSYLDEHEERLQVIRQAGPDDTIRLIVNSPGGSVNLVVAYSQAIRESSAAVITHAEGHVCSAGTTIWLSSKERSVSPLTLFMFHNYQGGTGGDGANMYAQVTFLKTYFDRLMHDYYSGVLTEEELQKIKGGGEVWVDELSILERLPDTVLMDEVNISRVKEGKQFLRGPRTKKAPKGDVETSTGGFEPLEEEKDSDPAEPLNVFIKLRFANGESFDLNAGNVSAKDLAGFSKVELYSIAQQLVALAGAESTNLPPLKEMTHETLVTLIQAMGKELATAAVEQEEAK